MAGYCKQVKKHDYDARPPTSLRLTLTTNIEKNKKKSPVRLLFVGDEHDRCYATFTISKELKRAIPSIPMAYQVIANPQKLVEEGAQVVDIHFKGYLDVMRGGIRNTGDFAWTIRGEDESKDEIRVQLSIDNAVSIDDDFIDIHALIHPVNKRKASSIDEGVEESSKYTERALQVAARVLDNAKIGLQEKKRKHDNQIEMLKTLTSDDKGPFDKIIDSWISANGIENTVSRQACKKLVMDCIWLYDVGV
jgi:hypothetical protein